MPTLTVDLPTLHTSQTEVKQHAARFKVLACGRRWGKTRLGVAMCIEAALEGKRAWWVAPSYKVGNVGWRQLVNLAKQLPGVQIFKAERTIQFITGGEVSVRSADNPDSLRGEGLDLVVHDECAFMQENTWTEAIRPALADRKGDAVFISTPKGRNWFWRNFQRGLAGDEDEWAAWQLPTTDNPFIDNSEVEAAQRGLPDRIFRQEFMAEFIDDAGGVFRRVMDAATATPQDGRIDGHDYAMGVDWARHHDYTVITVIDLKTKEVVHVDRFSQIDYAVQVGRLRALADRFKPADIISEGNSMGGPLTEQLQRDGLPVTMFTTTNATKKRAIEDLINAFERSEIRIPNDPTLISELQAFEVNKLPSGNYTYSAPDGIHDDMVISLALAWQAVSAGSWFLL